MEGFRWGILGPGNIARSFSKGLSLLPDAVKFAVGSRSLERAREFAAEQGFEKFYGSYEELARDPEIDAIYVATPHPMHEEATLVCLTNGKPVVCEKPFAANAKQATRMVECARQNKLFLMEGMWTRFQPSVRKAVELIDGGAIGKVKHVVLDFGFRSGVDPNGRLFAPALAGGSLLDVGVYNVSFASMLYKRQPDRILSHLDIGITGVDESASVLFNYGGGQSASLFSSIRLNTSHEAIIYGEEGSIRLYGYWHGDTVHLKNKDGASEIKCEQSGFCHEAAEVMACVGNSMKESPLMPLDESIEIMRTMDRIRFDNNLRYPFEEE